MKYYLLVLLWLIVLMFVVGCAGIPVPQEVIAESIGTVSQVSNVVTNEVAPWMLGVIILLAGWAIPSPTEMVRSVISLFRG